MNIYVVNEVMLIFVKIMSDVKYFDFRKWMIFVISVVVGIGIVVNICNDIDKVSMVLEIV